MKTKLIERFSNIQDWFVQSKNWQLKLVVFGLLLPFITLAFLAKGLTVTIWMLLAVATLVLSAPKLRVKMQTIPIQQSAMGILFIIASLFLIIFFPMVSLWGLKMNNGVFAIFGAMRMISSPMAIKGFPSPQKIGPVQPRKKKQNKRDKKRYH